MKKRFFPAALMAAMVSLNLSAGVSPQIINVAGRNTTSLDGQWKTIVDPFENGYYDYRLNPSDNLYAQARSYDDKTKLQEYDFDTDKLLFVPGDWNTQRPELYYYEGTVWYRQKFDYDLKPGQRLFLHFGGANYETIAWLNGKRLGEHVGGFTPFNFEITDLVKNGENTLVVKVDNKRHPEGVPTVNSDWWNFGGITRGVTLVETPSDFIRDYSVQLDAADPGQIACRVQLDGANAAGREIVVEIPELKLKGKATADANGSAVFSIKGKPQRWSPSRRSFTT